MLNFQVLLSGLGAHYPQKLPDYKIALPAGVLWAEENEVLQPEYIYLAEEEIVHRLKQPGEGLVLVCVGGCEEPDTEIGEHWIVLRCTLSCNMLLNVLSRSIAHWRKYYHRLDDACAGRSFSALLQAASQMTGASYFLFDSAFCLLERVEAAKTGQELSNLRKGVSRLTPGQVNAHFGALLTNQTQTVDLSARTMHHMSVVGDGLGYLLAVEHCVNPEFEPVTELLSERLAVLLQDNAMSIALPNAEAFIQLLQNIRVYYGRFPEQLTTDLKTLPHPIGAWVRFLVISFRNHEEPPACSLSDLRAIFPDCNIAVYDGCVTVLLSSKSVFAQDAPAPEGLEAYLEKYDALALLSNVSSYPQGIRTQYLTTREIMEFLPKIRFSSEGRLAHVKRYINYYLIHMCATHLMEEFGHDKLFYFAYPEVLSLTRYDQRNKSDLRDFLFNYITNDCNVTQTANALHMHRNTVFYKLNKIREVVGLTLDSSTEKTGLLFSCQVLRYVEQVQGYKWDIPASAMY